MEQERHFIVDILFVLALFGVFTVSALMLVTIGSEVYRHTVEDMDSNYDSRVSVAYLTEKLRQNDTLIVDSNGNPSANVLLSTLSDKPALQLLQDINGEEYCTYLYLHDGQLKELFVKSDGYIGPDLLSAGQDIMELADLNIEQVSLNLLSIQLTTPKGQNHHIYVSAHCAP